MTSVGESSNRMQQFISWIKYGTGILPHCICETCERKSMELGEEVRKINVGDLVEIPASEMFSEHLWTVIEVRLNTCVLMLKSFNGIRIIKELPEKDLTFVK